MQAALQRVVTVAPGISILERGWGHGNSVLLSDGLVDTGYFTGVADLLAAWRAYGGQGDAPRRVLLTHAHSDHAGGAAQLAAHGAQILAHREVAALAARWDTGGLWLGPLTGQELPRFSVDVVLEPGEVVAAGGLPWEVIAAGGHARGGVAFFCRSAGVLITGDALWEDGFGVLVPWFDGPDVFDAAEETLARLSTLPARVVVPGHGAPFGDLAGAVARAQARLAAVRADPARLRRLALRSLVGFRRLVEPTLTDGALRAWLETVVLPGMPPLAGDRAGTAGDGALLEALLGG